MWSFMAAGTASTGDHCSNGKKIAGRWDYFNTAMRFCLMAKTRLACLRQQPSRSNDRTWKLLSGKYDDARGNPVRYQCRAFLVLMSDCDFSAILSPRFQRVFGA